MDERQRFVRLGLFVIVSAFLLTFALLTLGWRAWSKPTFTFETYFNQSVAGLELGSPASFRGVPLGQVTEIITSTAAYEQGVPLEKRHDYIVVRVKASLPESEAIQMQEDISALVARGLRAQTRLAGVTGQQYLELDFIAPGKNPPLPFTWKPKYTYLPSAPSVTGEIIARAQSFLAKLDDADLQALVRDSSTLARNLDRRLEDVPVRELSESATELLAKLDSVATRFDGLVSDPSLRQTLDNASAISERLRKLSESGELDRTIATLDTVTARLDGLLGDNQHDVHVIVQDLRVTADNLRVLSNTLRRDPAGVLLGGPPKKITLPAGTP